MQIKSRRRGESGGRDEEMRYLSLRVHLLLSLIHKIISVLDVLGQRLVVALFADNEARAD